MFKRDIESILSTYLQFPVIVITGPRQSGKTTLAKKFFNEYLYVSLEDLKNRDLAQSDPERFLELHQNDNGLVIDEFQYAPQLLSAIQVKVDQSDRRGYFILTGSQNFLVNQTISQSLAGRVGILTLLPFSIHELKINNLLTESVKEYILNGFYPRIYQEKIPASLLSASYIQTYVERDVRQLAHVGDLHAFFKFITLCAARVGQLLNISEIAGSCGITFKTAQHWISILEASYIIFLLQPYFNNFNKRVTKSPKIYFYDTGLVCHLLGIESTHTLEIDRLYGNIFENFIIADLYKQLYHIGKRPTLFFWRDMNGRIEVDCLMEQQRTLLPIEIKSANRIASDFFDALRQWNNIAQNDTLSIKKGILIYGGQESKILHDVDIISWQDIDGIILQNIEK